MLEKRENFYYEEEELSLYEILEKVLDYKKFILTTFILGFILSFGAAYFLRGYNRKVVGSQDFIYDYKSIDKINNENSLNLSNLGYNPENILLKEANIDKFLEIPFLNEEFSKNKVENKKLLVSKKVEFLSKILRVTNIKGPNYNLTVTAPKQADIIEEVTDLYFSLLHGEVSKKITEEIEKIKVTEETNSQDAKEKLNKIEEELDKKLKNSNYINDSTVNLDQVVSTVAPDLWVEQKFYKETYESSRKKIAALEVLLETNMIDDVIKMETSLAMKEGKGIAKFILFGGVALTIFFIIVIIVLKEFTKGYAQYKNSKRA